MTLPKSWKQPAFAPTKTGLRWASGKPGVRQLARYRPVTWLAEEVKKQLEKFLPSQTGKSHPLSQEKTPSPPPKRF